MNLFGLGEYVQPRRKVRNHFTTRTNAIQACIDRTSDPTRRASLEHALRRVKSEAIIKDIALALMGSLDD
jgi:hypothetical protein